MVSFSGKRLHFIDNKYFSILPKTTTASRNQEAIADCILIRFTRKQPL